MSTQCVEAASSTVNRGTNATTQTYVAYVPYIGEVQWERGDDDHETRYWAERNAHVGPTNNVRYLYRIAIYKDFASQHYALQFQNQGAVG